MNDLISRQAAIDHLKKRLYETALNNNTEHPYYEEIADNRVDIWLNELPSAQPETHDKRTETHACDLISRKMVLALPRNKVRSLRTYEVVEETINVTDIEHLPSAQAEIVRCKDCIFHGFCRTSPKWAVAPKDDWYCADAERRTDDR